MKQYQEYKPTKIQWINTIPSSWIVRKLKYNTYIKARVGWHGLNSSEFFKTGDGAYCVTGTDFKDGIISWENCYKVTVQRFEEDPYIQLKVGDLVLTKDGTIGKVAIIDSLPAKATLNSGVFLIRPLNEDYTTRYLYWLIRSEVFSEFVNYTSKGSTIIHLYQDTLVNWSIPLPTLDEQNNITTFLDHKINDIDSIIYKKQQLISLLQEERTALINQAVTKGLDPNVKMKPSGIEWLGDVPEHWEVKKLRYLGSCQNGISQGKEYFGFGYPFVTYGDVYKNEKLPFNTSGLANSTDVDRTHYSVLAGDVLFTRTSETIEEIGIASTCIDTIPNATFSGFLIRFRPIENILNLNFSKYYFRSEIHRRFFVKEMNLVTRASLSQDLLKNLPVLIPPFAEQTKISEFIESETRRIDSTISKIVIEIELLEEYKIALINEVVTGKICVLPDEKHADLIKA